MHIQNPVEVWTRLIPDPHEPDALRPDLPPQVGFAANGGIVRDLLADGAPVATEYVSVFLEKEHANAEVYPQLAAAAEVPERDRLLVRMVRECRADGYAGVITEGFFNALDTTEATENRKRDIKDVLLQAVARGLSADKAEAIRIRLGLPAAARAERSGADGR